MSFFSFLNRSWNIFTGGHQPPKTGDALRFGILGAARIAPMALIGPAKQHAEVIVQAVAARDRKRAEGYAKTHGIPQVFGSYQELIDDPAIDAVYIPLPNGLHFEWTLKALARGKHVLLEKPSVSNAAEAELLFNSELLKGPEAPALLEAFHYRFQPSWLLFMSLIEPEKVAHARAVLCAPKLRFKEGDIRFNYGLAGGAMMDLGYTISVLRTIFAADPVECTSCTVSTMPVPNEKCDFRYEATWTFPNGGTGWMYGDLQAGTLEVMRDKMPIAEATHRPVVVDHHTEAGPGVERIGEDEEMVRTRKVVLFNFIVGAVWHRVDVEDDIQIRKKQTGEVIRQWTEKQTKKAYTFADLGMNHKSEAHWLSYKHQLDAFVDRIRGRPGTGAWVSHEDSVAEMRATDMSYEKSGLGVREGTTWRPAPAPASRG